MIVRYFDSADYLRSWRDMQVFTAARGDETEDEVWLCQHPPIFTQGLAGKPEHLLRDIGIPVIKVDRGGQITYHGPGQLVAYLLLDLRRRNYGAKTLVRRIEQATIDLLGEYGIAGARRVGAPGVYVNDAKIAALGLRIKNGCCYHGLSLNIAMDLSPFSAINPCGYQDLAVTQLADLCAENRVERVGRKLVAQLEKKL
jgi:lipoyl(octanoyl) transferase